MKTAISSVSLTFLKMIFLRKQRVYILKRKKNRNIIPIPLWKPENWGKGFIQCNNLEKKSLSLKLGLLNSLRIQ